MTTSRRRRRLPSLLSVAALLVTLVVTFALSWLASVVNDHNQESQLRSQARQAATLLTSVLPDIQTPLAAAAEVAVDTKGDPAAFDAFVASHVGLGSAFVSMSLWKLSATNDAIVTHAGAEPELESSPEQLRQLLLEGRRTSKLAVVGLFSGTHPRVGYAFAGGATSSWVVYAESSLPADRRLTLSESALAAPSPLADLSYAVYLGRSPTPADLVAASAAHLPMTPKVTVVVPFGDSAFTLVASARQSLTGSLSAELAKTVAGVGIALALAAGLVTDGLVRRRRYAEMLAGENRRLYQEQHGITQTLQHALLPGVLPQVPGMELAVRYIAGAVEVEIGGDWYDVLPLEGGHYLFAVGDVSGHGVDAATVMARLHFAIRAYAVDGDGPAAILQKLGSLLDVSIDRHFATVICGDVDVAGHALTLASAGHPPALVVGGEYLTVPVGSPVGVDGSAEYETRRYDVPAGATVLVYTDGLVERRGDHPDAGYDRLQRAAIGIEGSLDSLLTEVVASVAAETEDDTVILGMRWLT
ncbi:MAG: PP2C family protein-serine/threonine phosphatase [Acidimicrobiales bacterium]